jgi:hypothetical protein
VYENESGKEICDGRGKDDRKENFYTRPRDSNPKKDAFEHLIDNVVRTLERYEGSRSLGCNN